jgi:hypothetical protein
MPSLPRADIKFDIVLDEMSWVLYFIDAAGVRILIG